MWKCALFHFRDNKKYDPDYQILIGMHYQRVEIYTEKMCLYRDENHSKLLIFW